MGRGQVSWRCARFVLCFDTSYDTHFFRTDFAISNFQLLLTFCSGHSTSASRDLAGTQGKNCQIIVQIKYHDTSEAPPFP
jgi:hypothetical protein